MGNPNANGRTPEERFWAHVDRSGGPDACWPWTGAKQASGYGRLTIAQRQDGSHRVALAIKLGRSLEPGEVAIHSCDNPPCCNPAHLSVGTNIDNDRDKVAKGRSNRGERHGHARLTADVVLAIRAAEGTGTQEELAARFGVERGTISKILRRERWTHL